MALTRPILIWFEVRDCQMYSKPGSFEAVDNRPVECTDGRTYTDLIDDAITLYSQRFKVSEWQTQYWHLNSRHVECCSSIVDIDVDFWETRNHKLWHRRIGTLHLRNELIKHVHKILWVLGVIKISCDQFKLRIWRHSQRSPESLSDLDWKCIKINHDAKCGKLRRKDQAVKN